MSFNLMFQALSDPTRRMILMMLKDRDMNAGEIAEKFSISKPSISHHLHQLKLASLVLDERRGQNVVYSLNTTVFQEVIRWLFELSNLSEEGEQHEKIQ